MLNNQHLNTKSQKLYRVSPLKNYIVEQIDKNQNIKRLCRYLTTTPLLNRGMTYDQRRVNQPDLNDSLLTPVTTDTEATVADAVLIPYTFSPEAIQEQRVSIYVYSPCSTFAESYGFGHRDEAGRHEFMVDIVYPMVYDRIEPYGQERNLLIACEVMNLFDGMYVDEETRKIVGDCQFKIVGDVTSLRLSKTGYMITTIPLVVTTMTSRIEQDTLIR